ncbi:MAG: hypothetical protein MUF21_15155 [Gemmatimonadaceae bacterium]|nr:hypothetical protein [Gemmatimonadaceae bacterium]
MTAPPRDSAARAATDLLAPLASNIVYLQFQGAVRRATMDSLRRELVAAGFTAPGVERIEREFTSAVRFFHASDAALADSVARMVQARLAARGVRLPALPVQDLTRRRMPVPRGQLEVWVSP